MTEIRGSIPSTPISGYFKSWEGTASRSAMVRRSTVNPLRRRSDSHYLAVPSSADRTLSPFPAEAAHYDISHIYDFMTSRALMVATNAVRAVWPLEGS